MSAEQRLAIVKERQAKSLEKAKAALEKAQSRLARIEAETPHKVRLAELAVEMAEHREALKRLRTTNPKPTEEPQQCEPEGTVTTEDGQVRPLNKDAVKSVKFVIGRKRKGLLSPRDGKAAIALLQAIEQEGNVGDKFVLALKGRKNPVRFEVVEKGLKFETS